MAKILIIEDDSAIAAIERDYLTINGFDAVIRADGESGLRAGLTGDYALILLDLMLPGMDGFTVCKRLREALDIPILIVTARQEDIDKIRGLGMGADDYIEKPFSPSVLVARVKANLAQYERLKQRPAGHEARLRIGGVELDRDGRTVRADGQERPLKNKEFELLLYLMENPNTVFSRERLYERIWGMDALGDSATVAVHIGRLREKIERDPANPAYIQTVRGAGYRFKG